MIWELAGDYALGRTAARASTTSATRCTNLLYDKFKTASPYGARKSNITLPTQTLNVEVQLSGFALGDNNYPINPELRLINNSDATIPGGAQLEFDYPPPRRATSASSPAGR